MSDVLVTCGGRWVGLVLQLRQAMAGVPALHGGRVLIADRAALSPAGCFADASFVVPGVVHPEYVDSLLRLCAEQDVRVLVPHLDLDLERLAPHLERFAAQGTTVVCPPPELVELCRDKRRLEMFLRDERLPCPRSYPLETLREEVFPLFAKRRRGTASEGAGVCHTLGEAHAALGRSPDLLFQEYVTAPEVSVDAYLARDGHCTIRVPRLRDRVLGGEAIESHTIRCPAVNDLADRTLVALGRRGLRGPLNLQLFAGDQPLLIEVNARLGSACLLANTATGGRLFLSLLQEACGGTADGNPDDYRDGLHLARYWGEVYHDGVRPVEFFPARGEVK